MKRGRVLIVLVLVSMLLVPFVSAGIFDWFKDLFNIGDDKDLGGELFTLSGEDNLVAYYNFEGNANDVSGKGHDGINNGVGFVDGKVGQAGFFNGTSYIDLGDDSDFELQSHTISMWVKKQANGELLAMMGLQEQVSLGGGMAGAILRFNDDNSLRYIIDVNNEWKQTITNEKFTTTDWTHIAITKDGGNIKLWVNGVKVKENTISSTIDFSTTSSKKTTIGTYWEGTKSKIVVPFKGKIDEVKVWNVALSADEIMEEYQGGEEVCEEMNPLWDIDNNNNIEASTDGKLILKYLTGFSGDSLIEDSIGPNAQRETAEEIEDYFDCLNNLGILDTDGNGESRALSDGILINRYIECYTGQELIEDVVGTGATRTTAEQVISFLNNPPGWYEGACEESIICTDSDGGKNYGVKGSANLTDYYYDYCSGDYLYEYSCNDNIMKRDIIYVEISGVDYEIEYNGADKVTASNPTINFKIEGVEHGVNLRSDGSATFKLAGESLSFKNTSNAGLNDFNIKLLNKEYLVKEYKYSGCENGCQNGACIQNKTNASCTDSDGGLDYYTKGTVLVVGGSAGDSSYTDICNYEANSIYPYNSVVEKYCDSDKNIGSQYYTCPTGCEDGACILEEHSICQDLLNKVKEPNDFTDGGIEYSSNWNNSIEGDIWINNQREEMTEYFAGWNTYYEDKNYYFNYNVMVFDNKDIDLNNWLEERTSYEVCQLRTYWSVDDKENNVYICNWDILRNEQNIDNYQYETREIFWINKNTLVQMYVSSGGYLSDEVMMKIGQKRIQEFLNDLKDNDGKYIGWEYFNIDWPLSRQIEKGLADCSSEIPIEGCNPSWNCKIEPIVCPPHGYQTKTCQDYSCDNKPIEEQIYCSPGICSGCYVPRWLDSNDNICIPYGFRFENEFSSFEEKYYNEEYEKMSVEEFNKAMEGMIVAGVNVSGELILRVDTDKLKSELKDFEYSVSIEPHNTVDGIDTYYISQGDKADITIKEFAGAKEETFTIAIDGINFNSENPDESMVSFIIGYSGTRRSPLTMDAYCDINGIIREQKTVNKKGDWAKCQNSYECESNLCSSGECVEIQKMLDEASGWKNFLSKIACKLGHLFNVEKYQQCVVDRIGENALDNKKTEAGPPSM